MQGATILTYMSASYMLNGPSLGIVIGYEFSSLALPMNIRQWEAAMEQRVEWAFLPSVQFLPSFLFWGIVLASIIYLFLPLSFVSPLTSELTTTRLVSVLSVVATGRPGHSREGSFQSSVYACMKPEYFRHISLAYK